MIDQKYEQAINHIFEQIAERGLFSTHKDLSRDIFDAVSILEELGYIKLNGKSYKFTVKGFNASAAEEIPFEYIRKQLGHQHEIESKSEQLTELSLKDLRRRTGIYGVLGGAIGFIGLEGIKWLFKFIYSFTTS